MLQASSEEESFDFKTKGPGRREEGKKWRSEGGREGGGMRENEGE